MVAPETGSYTCGLLTHPVRPDSVNTARALLQCSCAQTIAQADSEGVLMKKAAFPKKNKTAVDVVPQKKEVRNGPVELDLADLKKVSGGLPAKKWTKTD
jgi:hypothetical protein